jgi:hypothetical protein
MIAKRLLRPTIAALAATGAAIVLLAGAGGAAAGDDDHHRGNHDDKACTLTHYPHDFVCVKVDGKRNYVDDAYVVRVKRDGDKIRDYKAVVWVQEPDGDVEVFRTRTRHDTERGHAYVKVDIDERFDDRSILCGAFYEEGDLEGVACLRLHD